LNCKLQVLSKNPKARFNLTGPFNCALSQFR
jgi:hypothetical protein